MVVGVANRRRQRTAEEKRCLWLPNRGAVVGWPGLIYLGGRGVVGGGLKNAVCMAGSHGRHWSTSLQSGGLMLDSMLPCGSSRRACELSLIPVRAVRVIVLVRLPWRSLRLGCWPDSSCKQELRASRNWKRHYSVTPRCRCFWLVGLIVGRRRPIPHASLRCCASRRWSLVASAAAITRAPGCWQPSICLSKYPFIIRQPEPPFTVLMV